MLGAMACPPPPSLTVNLRPPSLCPRLPEWTEFLVSVEGGFGLWAVAGVGLSCGLGADTSSASLCGRGPVDPGRLQRRSRNGRPGG